MIAWVINWLLDHTAGKQWQEEQDRILRNNAYYDAVIGQLGFTSTYNPDYPLSNVRGRIDDVS